jgi:5-methylcytosine-specific restriction endonuclease McrA
MNRLSPTYLAYMISEAWHARRLLALYKAGYRCQICGSREHLQVHHNNYERLGHELDSDLIVLCQDCHWFVTRYLRFRRWWRRIN